MKRVDFDDMQRRLAVVDSIGAPRALRLIVLGQQPPPGVSAQTIDKGARLRAFVEFASIEVEGDPLALPTDPYQP